MGPYIGLIGIAVAGIIVCLVGLWLNKDLGPKKPTEYKPWAEGVYDHADYVSRRYSVNTVVWFNDGTNVILYGEYVMAHPRGTKIKILANNIDCKIEKADEVSGA